MSKDSESKTAVLQALDREPPTTVEHTPERRTLLAAAIARLLHLNPDIHHELEFEWRKTRKRNQVSPISKQMHPANSA